MPPASAPEAPPSVEAEGVTTKRSLDQTISVGSFADLETKETEDGKEGGEGKKRKKSEKSEKTEERRARPGSIPPRQKPSPEISDADHDFFSEGEISVRHRPSEPPPEEALTIADKAKLRAAPDVIERRARFIRYTKWAVGGAALVCIVALAEVAFSPKAATAPASAAAPTQSAAIVAEPAPASASPVESASAPPVAASVSVEQAPSAAAPSAEPVASVSAEPAATASAAPSVAAPEKPPVGDGDAKEEKKNARQLLERRKLDDAVAAGERSVALDPTDGEAWLILGAAYQEKGNNVAARRAYASCVKEGKTGPRGECAKMLR
jgi:hypothetical protein